MVEIFFLDINSCMKNNFWFLRAKLGLWLMTIGFWMLPKSRYKSLLNSHLWTINLEMQSEIAVSNYQKQIKDKEKHQETDKDKLV